MIGIAPLAIAERIVFDLELNVPWSKAIIAGLLLGAFAGAALAHEATDGPVGLWELSVPATGTACRIQLRGQRSDLGDFFLSMPTSCRTAMPDLATLGRWAQPDATHLVLEDPTGAALLSMTEEGGEYDGIASGQSYRLKLVNVGRSAAYETEPAVSAVTHVETAPSGPVLGGASATAEPGTARFIQVVHRHDPSADDEKPSALAGRYAVMRENRDTGCMVTLDAARAKIGDRAQLAPGCRDQGIVIFDPSSWQIVKGELVLIARAGHKAKLLKQDDGSWQKDPKEGGKPLGLKRL